MLLLYEAWFTLRMKFGYIIRFAQQKVKSPGRISKSMTNHCFNFSSYIEISRYECVVTILCGWLGVGVTCRSSLCNLLEGDWGSDFPGSNKILDQHIVEHTYLTNL